MLPNRVQLCGINNIYMPSTQEFRRRIKSVNSTRQITRAMEMVASVKMQKSVNAITSSRAYIQTAWNLMELIKEKKPADFKHPFLRSQPVGKTAVILISSDRGLCGSFNSDILKKMISYIKHHLEEHNEAKKLDQSLDIIAVGKYSGKIARKLNLNLSAEFEGFENDTSYEDTTAISKSVIDDYLAKKYGKVTLIYSHFISSLRQLPVAKQILPVAQKHIDNPEIWQQKSSEFNDVEYTFEPNMPRLLDTILPQFIRMQVYGAILESNASEHSARMLAMKNATDNAKDLIDDLRLTYNTIRQDNITREIAEICAGAEAMK